MGFIRSLNNRIVAPHAGAWIETYIFTNILLLLIKSRPTRARGLKLEPDEVIPSNVWVAPHAGAWIETRPILQPSHKDRRSRPTRARGLKLNVFICISPALGCRAPRGRVD